MPTTDPLDVLLRATLDLMPDGQPRDRRAARIPNLVLRIAHSQRGLISSQQLRDHGVPDGRVARHLAAGRWVRVTFGVYLILPDAVGARDWAARAEQRALVAKLRSGDGVVPSGFAALVLAGIGGLPLRFVPEVCCREPVRLQSQPELRVRRVRTGKHSPRHPRLLELDDDTLVVAPVWAIAQVAHLCDRNSLVSILDSALNAGRITMADLDRIEAVLAGRPGAPAFRAARNDVDGRAESAFETRARLQCHDHGVPPDDLQRKVFDRSGREVARCDMVWELGGGRLLIVELDGDDHRRTDGIERDNRRDRTLTALGHLVVHFCWEDLATGAIWRLVRRVLVEENAPAA